MKKDEGAISPKRSENFPEWYQQVVKEADLAENSSVRGCMVIKPWGYGIWESVQRQLDDKIKNLGHENAYFPLFIPLSLLQKEAEHVEGFAKECAVVTHHRLESKDGKLVPAGELEEPLVIRPTSETIIGESFSKWVESWRDLPLLINQWANVVRWEMRPRVFLRTAEFLWQEGHTVHASERDAMEETLLILETYRSFMEDILALPVIIGRKSKNEKFPGAVETFCLEAMMQDRKAIQAGTSHYLGQNFSKAADIKFTNKNGELEYGYTTSWGVTTRLIGALVMTHGDDNGLRIPPRIAQKHVVILPVVPKPELEASVYTYADKLAKRLKNLDFHGVKLNVIVDKRDRRGGEKNWEWIKKGIPIRIEVGPRDVENQGAVLLRRDKGVKEKLSVKIETLEETVPAILDEIQDTYYKEAKQFRDAHIRKDIHDLESFKNFFTAKNGESKDGHGGFVLAKWSQDEESLKLLDELKVTVRCLPLEQSGSKGICALTGKEAEVDAIFAKAY